MYAVPKEHRGPNKFFAKTRRGIPNLENPRDVSKSNLNEMSGTKPVFHGINGKRSFHYKNQQESITVQHEEMIKYIHDTWKCTKRDLESGCKSGYQELKTYTHRVPHVTYYKIDKNNSQLSNFVPFDLESFWGQRLYQNITQST